MSPERRIRERLQFFRCKHQYGAVAELGQSLSVALSAMASK
jgi:hypothetical protein